MCAAGSIGILLRRVTVRGHMRNTRETTKFNQCFGVYIEECDFSRATDDAIDAVAVQVCCARHGQSARPRLPRSMAGCIG